MKRIVNKKLMIILILFTIILGFMPSSFRFLKDSKINALENNERWNPESDDSFNNSIIVDQHVEHHAVKFSEFVANIESVDDTYLSQYTIVIENAVETAPETAETQE